MNIRDKIETLLPEIISELFEKDVDPECIQVLKTRKEFKGDITVVIFPLTKLLKRSPDEIGGMLGKALVGKLEEAESYDLIKGFLNLTLSAGFWLDFFVDHYSDVYFGYNEPLQEKPVTIEFSSPNTNKPLHLGHIRNNLLGDSITRILDAYGYKVKRLNLVNDRGIHICKSMLAWLKWGNGETPESAGKKGDKLVGEYYVLFEKEYNKQIRELEEKGESREEAAKKAPLIDEAQDMLKKWEEGDPETVEVWRTMNNWVYEGFDNTYKRMNISFDKIYYESDTYIYGKKIVEEGLKQGVFVRKPNGSVWADLSSIEQDDKLLLRPDGTSVYITQDLGTAELRYNEFNPSKMIYVVGNEQNYHFELLKKILKKAKKPYSDSVFHLSYGMVELPEGKMKSREGKVVDADDLIDVMEKTAKSITEELGKTEEMPEDKKQILYKKIGIGALKYFILKVDPRKNMVFNPEESIDFNGHTAPFIMYTNARINSVLRKASKDKLLPLGDTIPPAKLKSKEKELIKLLYDYPAIIKESAEDLNPAIIANYAYEVAREFNQFYHEHSILNEPDNEVSIFRLWLASFTGIIIRSSLQLLGIDAVERM